VSIVDDTWIVTPVRGFVQGKSRLAPVLAPGERERLTRELLARTLGAAIAACTRPDRCIVVSPDPRARDYATGLGAVALEDPEPGASQSTGEASLNAALSAGATEAARLGASRVLVLAADLPGISADVLVRFTRASSPGGACIAADRHRRGTNALLLPAGAEAALRFGPDSLRAHREAFATLGIPLGEWHEPALAFDLDTPEDWTRARRQALLQGST
jgi:2-phospho-L-lactate guanylyltransferase